MAELPEFERLECRITFAQAKIPFHPLSMLYRFHSAAVSHTDDFDKRYMNSGESLMEALGKYASDLEKASQNLE